jgi:hypothetical protein
MAPNHLETQGGAKLSTHLSQSLPVRNQCADSDGLRLRTRQLRLLVFTAERNLANKLPNSFAKMQMRMTACRTHHYTDWSRAISRTHMAASDVSTNQHEVADAHTRHFLPSTPFAFPVALSNADISSPVCYTRVITFYKTEGLTGTAFDTIAANMIKGFQAAVDLFPIVRYLVDSVVHQLRSTTSNVPSCAAVL